LAVPQLPVPPLPDVPPFESQKRFWAETGGSVDPMQNRNPTTAQKDRIAPGSLGMKHRESRQGDALRLWGIMDDLESR
jgi:hypothetical protein